MPYRPSVNVKYGTDIAVLRISLGAGVISESWANRDIYFEKYRNTDEPNYRNPQENRINTQSS
jgi:hypothetical protein